MDDKRKIDNMKIEDSLYKSLKYKRIEYKDLTPEKDIKNGEEYFNALDWALSNPDIKNIALSGPYGSGKSSIIQSYIKRHPKIKALNISLATFKVENSQDDENTIEEGILKQLFYKVDANKIPQSRYRKLRKISINSYIRNIGGLSLTLAFVVGFILTDKTSRVIEKVLSIGAHWGMGKLATVSVIMCIWMISVLFLSHTFMWISKKFSLKEVKLADKAVLSEGLEDDASIFNKNMDEIVYFFEETKYDRVFIEDLDRFENTEIFIKLRELNTILNNYEQIKKPIVFIYAVRDDVFIGNERTKFFDFIIPVIPIINSTNSGEILREKLDIVEKKEGTYASSRYTISSRFITLISPFIEDMRILTNICNEFVIYKSTLRDRQSLILKDEMMFSMMVFKNLCPKDFSDLEAEKGIIKDAFNAKKDFIDKKIPDIQNRIEENQTILEKIESDVLQDLNEVKIAFINYLVDEGNYIFKQLENSHGKFTYADIMKKNFDIQQLDDKQVRVEFISVNEYGRGTSKYKEFSNLGTELINNGRNYLERCENIKQGVGNRKGIVRKNIEIDKREISNLRSYSLSTLINKFSSEEILPSEIRENKLLVFLLRHGYIDENYTDYINYFHPNSITQGEMNFILGIRNFESVGVFSYPLKNCGQILERIEDYEFRQSETLNFNLLDYMLTQKEKGEKYDVFMKQITNRSEKSREFIRAYLERGINLQVFIQEICHNSDTVWLDLITDNSISENTEYKYLSLILGNAGINDIKNNDISVKNNIGAIGYFIRTHKDILQRLWDVPTNKMIQVIETLDIRFNNLDIILVDEELLEYIFDNEFYELNHSMMKEIFRLKRFEYEFDLYKANYKAVRSLGYKPLTDYIYRNFAYYVQHFILDTETNTEEDIESVEDIVERLYATDINMVFQVIDKEPVFWEKLESCCADGLQNEEEKPVVLEIWNYILRNDRVMPSWKNFCKYRNEFGFSVELIKFLDSHIDEFIWASDNSIVNDEIVKEIIIKEISLSSFIKFIFKFGVEEFTNKINEFDEKKIKEMINIHYFPFSAERYKELREIYPKLCINFIYNNKEDFIACIEECELTQDEIVELLENVSFSNDDKIKILNQRERAEICESIALTTE